MPVNADHIRQLLTDLETSSDEEEASGTQRTGRGATSRALGSSKDQQQGAAAGRQAGSRHSRRQSRVDQRLMFLKKVHGGSIIPLNDHAPDPGCAFEARAYLQFRDPTFFPKRKDGLQMGLASTYKAEEPEIRRLTESYREAHWKLAAPKGFAALKGIPELQQLLAYSIADVVHYCTANRYPLEAPAFEPFPVDSQAALRDVQEAAYQLDSNMLHNDKSLIGQLCPGLRLCLVGEVATGLMCDSQSPPPDTPEHASALLLFLAAALRQVERECRLWGREQLAWTGPSLRVDAVKHLLDFCLCLNPQSSLQLLQQTDAQGLACQAAPWAVTSSSISSGGGGGGGDGSSPDGTAVIGSTAGGNAAGSRDEDSLTLLSPVDWGQSNLLLAAMEVATALLQPSSSSSPASSSHGACSSSTNQQAAELQEGTPLAANSSGAPAAKLPLLLQKVQLAFQQQQQELEQQQQEQEQQAPADQQGSVGKPASTPVSVLVSYITSMVDEYFDEHILLAPGETEGQSVSQAGLTAPAQSPEAVADSEAAAEDAVIRLLQRERAADSVAWHVAVVTGAVALSRMLHDARERSNPDASSPAAAAELVRELCPVQTALLFAAVEGLYFRVRPDLLLEPLMDGRARCECSTCTTARQAAEAAEAAAVDPKAKIAVCKADIASQMLMLLQMVQGFRGAQEAAAQPTASATTNTAQQLSPQQQFERDRRPLNEARRTVEEALQSRAHVHVLDAWLTASIVSRQRPEAPLEWFRDFFQTCGEQQLSPACLLQAANAAAAAAAAGGDAGDAAASQAGAGSSSSRESMPADPRADYMQSQWQILQHTVAKLMSEQLSERLDQGASAPNEAGSSALLSAAAAEARRQSAAESSDMVLQFLENGHLDKLMGRLFMWQEQWARCEKEVKGATQLHEAYLEVIHHRKVRARDREIRKERREAKAQESAASKQQRRLQRKMLRGEAKGGASSSSTDEEPSSSGMDEPAADDDERLNGLEKSCPACNVEAAGQPLIQLVQSLAHNNSSRGSSSSDRRGSGSTPPAAAGLYGSLPVSWSDPFMMRRLLWDLLGKLKPSAQEYFRKHFTMCPHRPDVLGWHAVVLSLARHIWAPPGEWGVEHDEQMALLLPGRIRNAFNFGDSSRETAREAARRHYASALDAAFDDQGANAHAAAVLSLHTLLALDPHGARVQPRPELLIYTPAGFHVAVSKTLMQALQVPAMQASVPAAAAAATEAATEAAPGAGAATEAATEATNEATAEAEAAPEAATEAATEATTAQAAAIGPAPEAEAKAAAAAEAGSDDQAEGGPEAAQLHLSRMILENSSSPHYLQAWSDVLFPAWYMWWHIGLLAYHQQQQQSDMSSWQQQRQRQAKQQQQQQQQGPAGRQYLRGQHARSPSPSGSEGTQIPSSVTQAAAAGNLTSSSSQSSSSSGAGVSAERAGGAGVDASGGSSSDGCVPQPVVMQDLYNDPNARLFAVGYAARQISSQGQLERLLSNPPVPAALQMTAVLPIVTIAPEDTCNVCEQQLKVGSLTLRKCEHCGDAQCSLACAETHAPGCSLMPARKAATARKWSILTLLSPPRSPQGQPGRQMLAAAAAPPSIPPALNMSLPGILQTWLSDAQQTSGPGTHKPLFKLHSNVQGLELVAAERARARELMQQLHVVRRHVGADAAGDLSSDDGDMFEENPALLELLRDSGASVIYTGRNGVWRNLRSGESSAGGGSRAEYWTRAQQTRGLQARRDARAQLKGQLAAAPGGPDRPGTPEQQQGVIAPWPAGRYGPMAAAAAGNSSWDALD